MSGVGGSLFPSRFLADWLVKPLKDDAASRLSNAAEDPRRRMLAWWRRVESSCGPATGLRALFDLAAMPLAGLLGFRARDARFDRARVSARLATRRGTDVGLVLLPWAARPSRLWRDLASDARLIGADWCLLVAPPFVSLVDARGHALRRSLDFVLPDALDERSFPAFWLLCQADAFDPGVNDGRARAAPIDILIARGAAFQDEVRQDLQDGVVRAIAALDPILKTERRPATADATFGEALTLVYRVLFLLFAESRDLVPRHHPAYGPGYAIGALCREAARSDGIDGLWDGLAAITRLSRSGCESGDLIVHPFNGRLFARASAPSLESATASRGLSRASRRRDRAIGDALLALGTRPGPGGRESISYADLGVEQLGAVYERVLDLNPDQLALPAPKQHGARRKETGTFYTPQSLAAFVVRRTLAPLLRGASTDDILALRIVDPAMGSGAFLVAACRFLAHAYEGALVDEGRCAETDLDAHERAKIRRLVARRCLAGVDANPVAVQLARLSLWLTTLARDKPLSFLDDRLRVGNSLIGASPDDLWRLIPRGRPNLRRSPERAMPLFDVSGLEFAIHAVAQPLKSLSERHDDTVADVRAKERLWSALSSDRSPLDAWRLAGHLWCARWFWPDEAETRPPSPPELGAALDAILKGSRVLAGDHLRHWTAAARQAAGTNGFFHWPLEFPDVFYAETGAPRDRPGFDAVIGNPPWEMLRRDDASEKPTPGETDPGGRFPARRNGNRPPGSVSPGVGFSDSRARTLAYLRQSGQYPCCDRGHLNLYQPFLERALSITRPGGRLGLVLPWGLASDEGAAALRARLLDAGGVDTIVGLDNAHGIFPIHRGLRFMALIASPGSAPREVRARFGVRAAEEIDDLPGEDEPGDRTTFPVRLTPQAIRRVGGPALRIPDARDPARLDWLHDISIRFPRLGDGDGWNVQFGRELNATDDRGSLGSAGLPVIDGKHIGPFSVALDRSSNRILPEVAARLLPDRRFARARLGYRDVSGTANTQALIAAIIPGNVVTTHTLFCLRNGLYAERQHFLCGLFNSSTLNAIVRMLMGGHVTTALVESLPVPVWCGSVEQRRIAELGERLTRDPADAAALVELHEAVAKMYAPIAASA